MLREQLEVKPCPTEVRRARQWARSRLTAACAAGGREIPADTVVLLVSELVTNAVVHTGRPAVLRLLLPDGGALRLEVADDSSRAPSRRIVGRDDTGGRGLELVELLADRWGWRPEGAGKSIWCEVAVPARECGHAPRKVPARY